MHILAISPGEPFDAQHWLDVMNSGIDALMVREKQLEARSLLELVRWVKDMAPELPVWVNGRLDVALATGCGFHAPEAYPEVPSDLLPLSRPIHEPAQFGPRLGCRQLIVSPVFPVPGKGPTWDITHLHGALDALPPAETRILALGGIHAGNAAAVKHPRLAGVAMIRALWASGEPARVVEGLRAAWGE